jgi:hypothetical protein
MLEELRSEEVDDENTFAHDEREPLQSSRRSHIDLA